MLTPEEKRDRDRERLRRWRAERPEKQKALRERGRKNENASCRRYYAENREAKIEKVKAWQKANPEKRAAYNKGRLRSVKERTPPWMRWSELIDVYSYCPDGAHVDHIVPLDGVTADGYRVSGLHVPWNLQYLSAAENMRKGSVMRLEDHDAVDAANLLANGIKFPRNGFRFT